MSNKKNSFQGIKIVILKVQLISPKYICYKPRPDLRITNTVQTFLHPLSIEKICAVLQPLSVRNNQELGRVSSPVYEEHCRHLVKSLVNFLKFHLPSENLTA